MKKAKNTAHILLLNNQGKTPLVYLIQEQNKKWGTFGGVQEVQDRKSFVTTAIRELQEETAGSLLADSNMFYYLDSYSIRDVNGGVHKTFIVINSEIQANHIRLDQPGLQKRPGNIQQNSDILRGGYFPLYLILSHVYKKKYSFMFNGEKINLRYFFAEAIRRNQHYLYTVFHKKYIDHTEYRNNVLGIQPVILGGTKGVARSVGGLERNIS